MSLAFDVGFLEHPAFAIFDALARERLASLGRFPEPTDLSALMPSLPPPWFDFELEDAAQVRAAGGFDRFVANTARIPTRRGSYHDLFGALMWLHFPELKTAIHRIQLAGASGPGRSRGARENAATHLDESGVLVVSCDPAVFRGLATLDWPGVFWQRRAALLETTRFLGFGHGLLDALRVPHQRLMSMALFARVSPRRLALGAAELRLFLDRELGLRVPEFLLGPARLQPLPALGVPGWWRAQDAEFYQNEQYFRRARHRLRASSTAAFIALD